MREAKDTVSLRQRRGVAVWRPLYQFLTSPVPCPDTNDEERVS